MTNNGKCADVSDTDFIFMFNPSNKMRMRKIIFAAMAAIAVLASCSNNKTTDVQSVVNGLYASADDNGNFELISDNGEDIAYLSDLNFEKIFYDSQSSLVLGYINKSQFAAFRPNGKPLLTATQAEFNSIETINGVVYLRTNRWRYIYVPAGGYFYGPYMDIKVVGTHIFAKNKQGYWGIKGLDNTNITDFAYQRLYIVDYKSDKEFDLLGYTKENKWRFFAADGTKYHVSSLNAAVKLLTKKYKPTEDVGMVLMYK